MKWCPSCKQELPLTSFASNKAKKDGLQASCRECKKVIQRKYYEANRESYRSVSEKSKSVRVDRNRRYVVDYLSQHGCVDCGEADIHVLEFDHVRGEKIAGVGQMIGWGLSLQKIQEEIDKCEVRCCNCHRRVTFGRRGIDFTSYL